jgi:hypothetical protein
MPYIPDLIPEHQKIIPAYFHKQPAGLKPRSAASAGPVLLGVLFLLIAVYFIHYLGFAALFGLMALSCTNGGRRWLERKGRFSLTWGARAVIYGLVVLLSAPVYLGYVHQDKLDAAARVAAHERALRFTADSLVKDSSRKAALYTTLQRADRAMPDQGLKLLVTADSLVRTATEKDSLQMVDRHLRLQLVQNNLDKRDYRGALAEVQRLLANDRKPELWFYRARC